MLSKRDITGDTYTNCSRTGALLLEPVDEGAGAVNP